MKLEPVFPTGVYTHFNSHTGSYTPHYFHERHYRWFCGWVQTEFAQSPKGQSKAFYQ